VVDSCGQVDQPPQDPLNQVWEAPQAGTLSAQPVAAPQQQKPEQQVPHPAARLSLESWVMLPSQFQSKLPQALAVVRGVLAPGLELASPSQQSCLFSTL